MRPTWRRTIRASAVLATALATLTTASAQAARPTLTHERALQIALRVAKSYAARHPKDILEASGRLEAASKMMERERPPGLGNPEAEKELMDQEGGPNHLVDYVTMRGHFVKKAEPDGFPGEEGRVLELIIDAHTGAVDAQGLAEKAPDLSRLGPVTRLR